MATKFYNDIYYTNSDIANVSGVHPLELNLIERHLLQLIGYTLLVTEEELAHYESGLWCHIQKDIQHQSSFDHTS